MNVEEHQFFRRTNGKPMRVRYVWSRITASSAHWEQAQSADAGTTWQTNWIMEFRRKPVAQGRH